MSDQGPSQSNPETVFRVYRLGASLRAAIQERRKELEMTVKDFLTHSLEGLPELVQVLQEQLPASSDSPRPMRLPLNDDLLDRLRSASEALGIPATRLLLALLARVAQTSSSRSQPTQAEPRRRRLSQAAGKTEPSTIAPEEAGPTIDKPETTGTRRRRRTSQEEKPAGTRKRRKSEDQPVTQEPGADPASPGKKRRGRRKISEAAPEATATELTEPNPVKDVN